MKRIIILPLLLLSASTFCMDDLPQPTFNHPIENGFVPDPILTHLENRLNVLRNQQEDVIESAMGDDYAPLITFSSDCDNLKNAAVKYTEIAQAAIKLKGQTEKSCNITMLPKKLTFNE